VNARSGSSLIEVMIMAAVIAISVVVAAGAIRGSRTHELVCSVDGAERVVARDTVYFDVQDGVWIGHSKGPGYLPRMGEVCWDRVAERPQ
jgi:hypothetical protein